jgi:hydroxymethylpyrimidine/phosphomethylpyrimidine kinase
VGGAGDKCVTAGAMHADLAVAGMDGCFHVSSETSIQTLDSTGVRKDSARQPSVISRQ